MDNANLLIVAMAEQCKALIAGQRYEQSDGDEDLLDHLDPCSSFKLNKSMFDEAKNAWRTGLTRLSDATNWCVFPSFLVVRERDSSPKKKTITIELLIGRLTWTTTRNQPTRVARMPRPMPGDATRKTVRVELTGGHTADGTVPMAVTENVPARRSLRFPEETDAAFRSQVERTARIARVLMEACFNNETVQDYIADPDIPFFTEQSLRSSPIVRVEYEQAIAFGGIGETLRATKSKSWGEGPFILPLESDDWFFPERITYCFRENSLYNRRFEQRRRMKEMLGKHRRKLIETAKYHTKTIFLEHLTDEEARSISRVFGVEPGIFWRAAKGKAFLDLPARWVQQELPFAE